ncbi:hypothetical protein [Myroides injenensis]|uniref:hypothetical protein n=1 Tax=Myroides injenensis TaxID=1183151 RepID=UPI000287F9E9|nr:hypothetical protein [Myroides injenensis]
MYRLEIQKLLLEIEEHINNVNYIINIYKQAIQIADRNGDLEWGVDLRYDLIHEERSTSACIESIPAFAWILNICDQYPEQFEEADFLLEYEWMLCSAYSNSLMTLDQINAIADDLYQRLDRNELSKRGYYFTMAEFAQNLGDFDKGVEYIQLAMKEPFDEENVEAMEYDYRIENLVLMQKFDEAINLMEQMELKKLSAFALPFETYCAMAYCMARAKDPRAIIYLDKAKSAMDGLREINSSMLYSMTRLMYTMYLLEDELLWSTYERIADWEINAEDDLQFMLSRHMAIICKQGGVKELSLSPKLTFYAMDNQYDLNVLADYYANLATTLAQQFDKRNGSTFCSQEFISLNKEIRSIK